MGLKKERVFSIPDAVRNVIHDSKVDIEDLADLMGCSSNLLYRMALEGPSGTKFIEALQKAVQLTRITGNDAILRTMARLTDRIIIKEPRGTLKRRQQENVIAEFNMEYALILKTLALFLKTPNETLKRELFQMLTNHMEHTAQVRRRVQRDTGQYDLFERSGYAN